MNVNENAEASVKVKMKMDVIKFEVCAQQGQKSSSEEEIKEILSCLEFSSFSPPSSWD